ncbi:alpha-tocopherol transfer protein-like [Diorhabda carinulata]|uniref:alpha-tocopherol transfer protein-like n=1 Tax=Diorhabda carinulata TaxID=1163345 RepID=UPI0025A2A9AE|nr:alpha-tocopherol transfer protein-like [Diorhabda carinulata]
MSDINLDYDFKAENLIACGRTTKEAIEEVRNWILSLQDEYVPRTLQDEIIVLFLLSCDNDVALSKKTIINFYSLKKDAPELHDNRDPSRNDIKLALEIVHMSSIPVRTNDNSVIHYFHIHDTNYKKFELIPILKLTYMLIDISQEKNPPDGLIAVLDLKGINLMHFLKIKVWVLKKYLQFLEEGMTMKIKSIHILNSAYFIDKLMAIVKSIVKNEFLNKIHIHQSDLEQEVLFQLIPKKCLPKEYGGDLPSKYELHQKTIEQFKRKQYFWNAEEQLRKSAHKE